MRPRVLVGIAASATLLTACEGLKEALTAHVDVVAKAGTQELSVTRLGDLLGGAKIAVPVTRDNTAIIADIWTGYQQLAYAAAHGDSLKDKKSVDLALAPYLNVQKVARFKDSLIKMMKVDSGSEAAYNQGGGGLLAARHILIGTKNPSVPATAAEKDSLRKLAATVRGQVTSANFAEMARKYSADSSNAKSGGNLGVFRREMMVAPFSNATAALKPGDISQPVETQFGFHIIQRLTYAEAQKDFAAQYSQAAVRSADSAYQAKLGTDMDLQVKDNAPAVVKDAAKDANKHHADRTVLATFKGGTLSVAEFLDWVEGMIPAQQNVMQRIPQAPDSVLKPFVKQMALQQILLTKADSAKIEVPAADRANMYNEIAQLVTNIWQALGVDPKMLADSAKSVPEKERLAASRVDNYLDRMMGGQAQPISPPPPLRKILDSKYEATVNSAGIDRAYERAQKVRASADSARAANQPKSQIPLPGAGAPPVAPPASKNTPKKP